MMAKKKLKDAASAGLDALDMLERQANEAAAASGLSPPAPAEPQGGGGGGKKKLKAAALAGLQALDAAVEATAATPPPVPPPAPASVPSMMDELLKAKALLDAGVLTAEEFAQLKAKLIAQPTAAPAVTPALGSQQTQAHEQQAQQHRATEHSASAAAATSTASAAAAAAASARAAAGGQEAADRARASADAAVASARAGSATTTLELEPPASGVAEAAARRAPRIAQWADAPEGFASLGLDQVVLQYKDRLLLNKASWDVKTGERVGLVGPNGCGKSTQLRLLTEELQPDSGCIVKSAPGLEVAMLRQEFLEQLVGSRTLLQELVSVFVDENVLLARNAELEGQLAAAAELSPEGMSAIIDELSTTQRKLEQMGAYGLEQRALRLLDTMGFTAADASAKVSTFSGGWKMRIGLSKLLLKRPQVLLLDEPTNHLDLESVEWLEAFLRAQDKLAIVVVSHDREFLDRVCTKVVETEDGSTFAYPGGYTDFKRLKGERLREWRTSWDKQEREESELRAFVQKFHTVDGLSAQVKAKEKALERLRESAEYVPKPPTRVKQVRIEFPPAPRSAKELVTLEDVSQRYGSRTVIENVELTIERGDRVAIVGANGAGKSTLLRLMLGQEQPTEGRVHLASEGMVVGYFEQDQANALDLDKTVIETMEAAAERTAYEGLRAMLGRFMFKGDDVDKKVGMLSGGEKGRLALCRMMLTPCNVLILDEPTNHLDIDSKETLETALQGYDGTLITVSHDRYFVSQVASVILSIENSEVIVYDGDYKHFMEQNDRVRNLVEGRYVEGERTIRPAPKFEFADEETSNKDKKKKNFGGKGVTSGRKDKGIKNAKRQA